MSLATSAPDELAHYAARIGPRRRMLGISGSHFAALTHLTPFSLSRIEHGQRVLSSAEATRIEAVLSTLEQAQASARERATSLLAS